ncbi:uncharacterized protein [Procambarus clarkii]
MVTFQADLWPRNDSWLWWQGPPIPTMTQVTFCTHLTLRRLRRMVPLVSYSTLRTDNEFLIVLDTSYSSLYFTCCDLLAWRKLMTFDVFYPIHICLAVDLSTRNLTVVLNDEVWSDVLEYKKPLLENETGAIVQGGGYMLLGIDQDEYGGLFKSMQSLCGDLTDLRLYSVFLPLQKMIDFVSCLPMEVDHQPVIDLTQMHLFMQGKALKMSNVSQKSQCAHRVNAYNLIFPVRLSFHASVGLCHKTGGHLGLPQNNRQNENLIDLVMPYQDICGDDYIESVWLGLKGDLTTYTWRHYQTWQIPSLLKISYEFLYQTEAVSCISVSIAPKSSKWHGFWFPTNCNNTLMCTYCEYNDTIILRLRGLCGALGFDTEFILTETENRLIFLGKSVSRITWGTENNTIQANDSWNLIHEEMDFIRGQMLPSQGIFPIGRHRWYIESDRCGSNNLTLSFSICQLGEFTCDDGTCIPLDYRCNLNIDCEDQSDEADCEVVVISENYNQLLPPPGPQSGRPMLVDIDVNIEFIKKLDVMSFMLEQDLQVHLLWHDSRLKFRQLRQDPALNAADEGMIWTPEIEMRGEMNSYTHVITHTRETVVLRETSPLPDNTAIAKEDLLYEGWSNRLRSKHRLTVTSACHMDLTYYPFDSQHCSLTLLLDKCSLHDVFINNTTVIFTGMKLLLEYNVEDVTLKRFPIESQSCVQINIIFTNLNGYFISNTYIPTFLLVIISYITFFFDMEDFTNRIMVALTSLLVLASLFAQTSIAIPRTAYLKLIDVWFVFCICMDFFMVVMLVVTDVLLRRERLGQDLKISYKTAHVFPVQCVGELSQRKKTRPSTALVIHKITVMVIPLMILIFVIIYIGIILYA